MHRKPPSGSRRRRFSLVRFRLTFGAAGADTLCVRRDTPSTPAGPRGRSEEASDAVRRRTPAPVDPRAPRGEAAYTPSWGHTVIAPAPTPTPRSTASVARRTPLGGTPVVRRGTPATARAIAIAAPAEPFGAPGLVARNGAARRRRRPSRTRRNWRRLLSPFTSTVLRDLEVVLWLIGAIAATAVAAPFIARSVPARLHATLAVQRIGSGFNTLFDSEERILRETGLYEDPAKLALKREITPLLDPTLHVVRSTADDNHWFLQVRSDAARTICSSLVMTYVNWRGGGYRMQCRDLDGRDALPRAPDTIAPATPRPIP